MNVYIKNLRLIPLEERIVLDAAAAAVIYVNSHAAPGGDGASWAHAFNHLQDALTKAASTSGPDQIWIAAGTYTPQGGNASTFVLPDNVALYGGFKGTETTLSNRNPYKNVTILSGDQLGNDINNSADPGYLASKLDNSWHVISAYGVSATIDGLTIQDGFASSSSFISDINALGGGMNVLLGASVSVNQVMFQYNSALAGGGINVLNANASITNSTFLFNHAEILGGGVRALDFSSPLPMNVSINGSFFGNNSSNIAGGGVDFAGINRNSDSMMSVDKSIFTNNSSIGGGALGIDSIVTHISASAFKNNTAFYSGGAVLTVGLLDIAAGRIPSSVTVDRSLFIGNQAIGSPIAQQIFESAGSALTGLETHGINGGGGGAIANTSNIQLSVKDSQFIGNAASNGFGGAILNGGAVANPIGMPYVQFAYGGTTTITRSAFSDNHALNGGALGSLSLVAAGLPSSPEISSFFSVFYKNSADNGGAIYLDKVTANIFGNLFFQNNTALLLADQIYASNSTINGTPSSNSLSVSLLLKMSNLLPNLDSEDLFII